MHGALRHGLLGVVALAGAIQLVPYERDHEAGRPAVLPWPSQESAKLFEQACADSHTEQTDWPWYSNVAPMSWLVQQDVDRGRDERNLSAAVDDLDDAAETIVEATFVTWGARRSG